MSGGCKEEEGVESARMRAQRWGHRFIDDGGGIDWPQARLSGNNGGFGNDERYWMRGSWVR